MACTRRMEYYGIRRYDIIRVRKRAGIGYAGEVG